MRRPGLWAIIGLALAVAGLVVAWLRLQANRGMPAWQPGSRASQSILQIGLALLIGGLVLAGIACLVLRKRNQLARGEGVIAHWRVGLLDWDSFQRRDAARDVLFRSLRNRLRLPAELPPEGMEIRVGADALLVGDGCYGLGYFASRGKLVDVGLVEGRPAMLEFTTLQTGKNSSRIVVFRVPVPATARAGAQAVLDHFSDTIDQRRRARARSRFANHFQAATGDAGEAEAARAADQNRNWRAIGLACLAVGGAMLGITWVTGQRPAADPAAIGPFTIAGGAVFIAGLLALAWSVLGRR